jgi:hypothetical protein
MNTRATSGNSSRYHEGRRRGRVLLVVLAVAVIIGMIIGLIFVAHHYYHMWGGQGFLKARSNILDPQNTEILYSVLPLRQVAKATQELYGFDHSGVKKSRSILPFYPCGDQQQSCEAYSRPVRVPFPSSICLPCWSDAQLRTSAAPSAWYAIRLPTPPPVRSAAIRPIPTMNAKHLQQIHHGARRRVFNVPKTLEGVAVLTVLLVHQTGVSSLKEVEPRLLSRR